MADVRPFFCVRPDERLAHRVAALPYDVYNRAEAKKKCQEDELTFLRIDRPESQFDDDFDMYSPLVYEKARDMLNEQISSGVYVEDGQECYYIYELIMNGRHQTGIVACASVDDYLNGVIKKHENTREEKEQDRIRHVDTCSAQTGPIFLAYRNDPVISGITERIKSEEKPLYAFTSDDGITHNVWKISGKDDIGEIASQFGKIESIYIADGHHRAASAVKVSLKRRSEDKERNAGNEKREYDHFLSVLFPEDQLMIMPYNRVVKDLNGLSIETFLEKIGVSFDVSEQDVPVSPASKYNYGMYLDGKWYLLKAKDQLTGIKDPVDSLDVSILQNYLLKPVLGIEDPRTDKRIDFIGGIRGLSELERRVHTDMKVAFSMYPTSIQELFAVSDAGMLMPPKSTWFEPKLRSGLFIHRI
ncbi:MAG: DUF1015 domain-containing protein [Lachnospiraceae bacterium]|nr:DUF1015 domain-containing protein [Lachnospiraceae bacterium]